MSGYVEAGYAVVFGTVAAYAATLVVRERAARRRLRTSPGLAPAQPGSASAEPLSVSSTESGGERP